MAKMIIELPQVGESVTEGIISRWLVKPGETVRKYDPLVEVMTDKVNMEVPAPYAGTLTKTLVEEGETVPMGQAIAEMEVEGEVAQRQEGRPPVSEQPSDAAMGLQPPHGREVHSTFEFVDSVRSVGPTGSGEGGQGRPDALQEAANAARTSPEAQRLSPLVKRLIDQHGVDPDSIEGTGMGGRITKEDVLAYVERQGQTSTTQRPAASVPSKPQAVEGRVMLSPLRKTIAEHMARSASEIPAAWTMVEVDVTGLVRYRERFRESFEKTANAPLTYLPFSAYVVSRALVANPMLNARWSDDGVMLNDRVHLGIAVSTDAGLIVPVVHNANSMSVRELAQRLSEIVESARRGTLKLEDVQGGTFTLNNTGALGSTVSAPIINHPQAAIVTTEAIVKRPVVVNGDSIAIRSMMNVCLTFDHRVCDGAEAGRFLADVKAGFEAIDESSGLL